MNQFRRKRRKLIDLVLSPAVFNRYVLAFDIAYPFEALTKGTQALCPPVKRLEVKKPNHRHRRLLRPCRERPRDRRAAEQCDELPPPHAEHGGFLPGAAGDHSR